MPTGVPYNTDFIDALADDLDIWIQDEENWWLGEFAAKHKLHRQLFPDFSERNEKFCRSYASAKQIQENRIVKKGMDGKNPAFVIFTLKNVAKWRNVNETSIPELDGMGKILAEAAKRAANVEEKK